MRALLVYEFGSGLGHVNRLISIARCLHDVDEIVFVLPESCIAERPFHRLFGERVKVQKAYQWFARTDRDARQVPTHTFADVIGLFSFDDPAVLGSAVEYWHTTVGEIKPDIIISDLAPAMRLAIGDSVPMVVVGNGYTIPPPGRMMPPIRPWQTDVPAASRAQEGRLLHVINKVRSREGGPAVHYVADLFSSQTTFVSTLSEFDPYAQHRTEPVTWPYNVPIVSSGPSTWERSGPDIFVYLPASHPMLYLVIAALNGLERSAHVYITGADPHEIAKHCAGHVAILRNPADFADLLPRVRLLIHHAGLGTAYSGLAAGTPQLVLPLNLEHLITSRGLTGMGVALGFNKPPPEASQLSSTIEALLNEPAWMERAMARAAVLATTRKPDPLSAIVSACQSVLAESAATRHP